MFCLPSKVPISTEKTLEVPSKGLGCQIIYHEIKKNGIMCLLPQISQPKFWSNCTCRGCFEIVRTAYFKSVPDFENKICGCDRSKQNKLPPLYIQIEVQLCLEAFSIF